MNTPQSPAEAYYFVCTQSRAACDALETACMALIAAEQTFSAAAKFAAHEDPNRASFIEGRAEARRLQADIQRLQQRLDARTVTTFAVSSTAASALDFQKQMDKYTAR